MNQDRLTTLSLRVIHDFTRPEIEISLIDVHHRWGCLRSVSLQLQRGRVHLIVGANGSGKTQLLRLIAGLEEPAAGAIIASGRRVLLGPETLFSRETIGETLNRFLLRDEIWADIDRLVERFGLPPRDVMIGQLSCGQRQRLLLLVAMGSTADVVLFDSPMEALDTIGRDMVTTVIEAIVNDGRTVVAATVNPELLMLTDSNRIWVGDGHVRIGPDQAPALVVLPGGRDDKSVVASS